MTGEHGVGRIIARPFVGEPGSYVRTSNRHDFSLDPPGDTLLDRISAQPGLSMLSVGKIVDISRDGASRKPTVQKTMRRELKGPLN